MADTAFTPPVPVDEAFKIPLVKPYQLGFYEYLSRIGTQFSHQISSSDYDIPDGYVCFITGYSFSARTNSTGSGDVSVNANQVGISVLAIGGLILGTSDTQSITKNFSIPLQVPNSAAYIRWNQSVYVTAARGFIYGFIVPEALIPNVEVA